MLAQDGAVLSPEDTGKNNLQYYKGLVADVNAQDKWSQICGENGDGFTLHLQQRKSDGTASGIQGSGALKAATEESKAKV